MSYEIRKNDGPLARAVVMAYNLCDRIAWMLAR